MAQGSTLAALVLGGVLAASSASPIAAEELLVRRTGERATGALQACVGERCQWRGSPVPRAEIAWIAFAASGSTAEPPAPADPTRDTIWLSDGRTITSPILGISLSEVALDEESFDRSAVAWIYFGSPEGAPAVTARAPRAASPASRTASAPPTAAIPAPATAVATTPAPAAVQRAASPPPPAATLLLNEISFLPAASEAPWVELRNSSERELLLDGVTLRDDRGKTVALPRGTKLAPGELLLLRLGGKAPASPGTLKLSVAGFLGRERGGIWLSTQEGVTDGVTWGLPSLASVELCRGGRCAPPARGSVVARLPDVTRPLSRAAWAPLDAELASPGAPNPRPPVSALAAFPGALFFGRPRFSWYSVPGAAGYRLEVARDARFAAIVHRATIAAEPGGRLQQLAAEGPELPAGDYFWRVVATYGEGATAEPSPPIPFRIRVPARRAVSSLGAFDRSSARASGGGAEGPPAVSPAAAGVCAHLSDVASPTICKELDVPVLDHAKDTRMLTLESWREQPIGSWDTPDFGPYPYCARAGVAMVHEYYRRLQGAPRKLSQDRIGYQVYKELRNGPEYDLPVVGIVDSDTSNFSLPLALGTRGEYHAKSYSSSPGWGGADSDACYSYVKEQMLAQCAAQGWAPGSPECLQHRLAHEAEVPCPSEIAYAWGYASLAAIRAEIDAGRPVISTNPSHLFLWVGYAQVADAPYLIYQDAGGREPVQMGEGGPDRAASAFANNVESFWTGLAPVALGADEEGVAKDSDGDGLVDFDEQRFGTKANDRDSDDDGVEDKAEIRYSVWDPDRGYHRTVQGLPSTASSSLVEAAAAAADLSGRDPDGDGKAMELDPDSDGGGCDDGEENANGDGQRDASESSNFAAQDDPTVAPGECGELWTGSSVTTFSTHQPEGFTEITVAADLRFRETRRSPIIDPGPEHGGKNAGDRIGSISSFTCAGTSLHVTWNQRYWSDTWSCTCTGEGDTTMGEAPDLLDGFILRKRVDWSLTPILGYDLPRATPLYAVACSARPDETFTVNCNCTTGGSTSGTTQYPYPAGAGLGNPLTTTRCNHDPELRYLSTDGNQMVGSYRIVDPSCAPDTAVSTWSLSKAGTPPAPLPPLP